MVLLPCVSVLISAHDTSHVGVGPTHDLIAITSSKAPSPNVITSEVLGLKLEQMHFGGNTVQLPGPGLSLHGVGIHHPGSKAEPLLHLLAHPEDPQGQGPAQLPAHGEGPGGPGPSLDSRTRRHAERRSHQAVRGMVGGHSPHLLPSPACSGFWQNSSTHSRLHFSCGFLVPAAATVLVQWTPLLEVTVTRGQSSVLPLYTRGTFPSP